MREDRLQELGDVGPLHIVASLRCSNDAGGGSQVARSAAQAKDFVQSAQSFGGNRSEGEREAEH